MTADAQQIEKIASREATDWFLLLSEEPDDVSLRRDFEAWLAENPVNQTAWYAMQQASEAMDKTKPVLAGKWQPRLAEVRGEAAKPAGAENLTSIASHRRRSGYQASGWKFGRFATLGGGVVALAACLLVAVTGPSVLRGIQSDYATGTAETRTVMLEDGSAITLAPESAVTVSYSADQRTIGLLEGEAFFDVATNPKRPFVVEADEVETTVLGTGFEVLRAQDGVGVSVEHGQVRVDYVKDGISPVMATLEAGQSVHVDWSGAAVRGEKPLSQIATWRAHQLIARDEALGSVVDQMRSYYGGKIVVLGDELSAEPVTGVYNLADPIEALYGIARAGDAEIWQVSPWLVIVSR
ncbi:FecR domain-containing protein [Thalassospira sp. HJ]|uniref:FecR family protein n=1 Tax=Thalassospira sp. HJ TaxID=1616823 RepID=UPI0005CF2C76|nr:FecR domain-containing protein [Thalassospira sp. HJ]